MAERRPFARIEENRWLAGAAGGIAYAMGWPVLVVRLTAIALVVLLSSHETAYSVGNFVILAYLAIWIFAPRWRADPADYVERTT